MAGAWWTGAELEYGLSNAGVKVALVDTERFERLKEHFANCRDLQRVYVCRASEEVADPREIKLESVLGTVNEWGRLPERRLPEVVLAPEDDATIFYIYCIEVENVLYEHPAVMDAALVGIPHRTLGEEPGAVVQLKPGSHATEDELRAWVAERLAAFKVPVRVVLWPDTLPRNPAGKILKADLKRAFTLECNSLTHL